MVTASTIQILNTTIESIVPLESSTPPTVACHLVIRTTVAGAVLVNYQLINVKIPGWINTIGGAGTELSTYSCKIQTNQGCILTSTTTPNVPDVNDGTIYEVDDEAFTLVLKENDSTTMCRDYTLRSSANSTTHPETSFEITGPAGSIYGTILCLQRTTGVPEFKTFTGSASITFSNKVMAYPYPGVLKISAVPGASTKFYISGIVDAIGTDIVLA